MLQLGCSRGSTVSMVTKPHRVGWGVAWAPLSLHLGSGLCSKSSKCDPCRSLPAQKGVVNLPPAMCGAFVQLPLPGLQSPGHPGSSARAHGPPSLQDITGRSQRAQHQRWRHVCDAHWCRKASPSLRETVLPRITHLHCVCPGPVLGAMQTP